MKYTERRTRAIAPARTLAAKTRKLERTLTGLLHQAYGLRPSKKPGVTPRLLARTFAQAAILSAWGTPKKSQEIPSTDLESLRLLLAQADHPAGWLARDFSAPAIAISDTASRFAALAEGLAQSQALKQKALRVRDELHQALTMIFRSVSSLARLHALRVPSHTGLPIEVLVSALTSAEDLPKLFEMFEKTASPDEFAEHDHQTLYIRLAQVLVGLVNHFEKMCEKNPERFRYLAQELPYWPMLVTIHKAGYRKRFQHLTGPGFLELGAECPLDTSPRAMYRLDTPVCGLLWEEVFQDWLAVFSGVRAIRHQAAVSKQPLGPEHQRREFEAAVAHCCATEAEKAIFRAAYTLPQLRKRTASAWADQFVIPYLHLKYPDWQKVPALEKFMGKKGGDTQAEREIRRAVSAMARD